MAYSATVTITHAGGRDYQIQISETEAGAATEATITGLPNKGIITDMKTTKSAGSATTVAPIVSTSSGSSAAVHTVCKASAAADQNNAFDPPAKYLVSNGTLYYRTVCDAGSDNTVTTLLFFRAGW
jgi:hypothetical protein